MEDGALTTPTGGRPPKFCPSVREVAGGRSQEGDGVKIFYLYGRGAGRRGAGDCAAKKLSGGRAEKPYLYYVLVEIIK